MLMKKLGSEKARKRLVRKIRIRNTISGTAARPRVSVFRSSKHVFVQAIDDTAAPSGRTLCSVSSQAREAKSCTVALAKTLGEELAQKLGDMKVTEVVFDRNGFLYHGQIAAVAEGLRAKGVRV
jgi:large subunit ribosomal protein L18